MTYNVLSQATFLLVFGSGISALAFAHEEEIKVDQLPALVRDAAKTSYPEGKITKASKERDEGRDVFELKIKNKDESLEATYTGTGDLVAIEKVIALQSLPEAVKVGLEKRYPGSTLIKAEQIEKSGAVSFEIKLTTRDKKKLEATFEDNGKFLEQE